ncbi:flagellar motor protein MotB [Geodermatophilus sp. SYSU D00691]
MSSGSGGGRRRGKKHEEEEHENHERWLVSYADMMTLLLVLFVVLFAMSQVDKEKFAALAAGLSDAFGAPVTVMTTPTPDGAVLDGLPGAIDIASDIPPDPTVSDAEVDAAAAQAALERAEQVRAEAAAAYAELAAARDRIDAALTAAGYEGAAQYEIDERGLVVHVISDGVLYDAESAALRADGIRVLNAVAPELAGLPNQVRVEGHTNSVPVTPGGPYPSNWELSTDRATAVVRHLISRGLPANEVSATGYADTRPLVPDSDPAAVTVNRRVDIVVVSTASAEANAQLASLDAANGN